MDLKPFTHRLDEMLGQSDERCRQALEEARRIRAEEDVRRRRFDELARSVFDDHILPRLAHLAGRFPQARLVREPDRLGLKLDIPSSDRHTKAGQLALQMGPDAGHQRLSIRFDSYLIPILEGDPQTPRGEAAEWPVDGFRVEEPLVWLDERLFAFVQAYVSCQRCRA